MVSQEYHLSIFFFLLPLHLLLYFSSADDGVIMAKLSASFSPAPSDWTGKSYCNWSGITCDSSNNVTSINLPYKSLSGSLPYEIYQLSQLETIYVHGNSLSGPLPTFFNMRFLREIILDSNEFTLVPPNFLAGLGSLKTLSISDNSNLQSWQIPDSSGSTTFENFYASNSSIFGSIPDYFDSFPNLKNLRLSYNNITGVLPKSLRGSKIQNLWLNDQAIGLSGTIDVLSSMSQLSQVWLHGNAFTGQVPDLSNCTNLFDLQLDNNRLTGVLPPSLMELPKLINISLLNNKLQGEYPVFKSSVKTSIDTNNFCMKNPGPCDPQVNILLEIAKDFGYPLSLARAWTGNDACDEWTSVTCDSQGKRVQDLDFTEKHFSGKISPAFANLTSLRNLLLRENNLTGAIPETLTTLDQLEVLDVSNNNLSGPVPSFRTFVKVIMDGNSNIGIDVSSNDGNINKPDEPRASKGNSSSGGMIAGVVIAVSVFVGGVLFVSYKCYIKKRHQIAGGVQSPEDGKGMINGNVNYSIRGYGGTKSELQIQSSGDHRETPVFEVGNVVISVQVLRQVTDNFSENNILGRGGFGVVYKGELNDGTQMAIKRMKSGVKGTKGLKEFEAEIAVLTKVRHRHLVGFLGYCIDDTERLLVYEYMPQGTLSQHLFQCQKLGYPPLTWNQRVTIALDVARGVEYLHTLAQSSFIHRDLKPSNILLGNDMRAKVADFGLVKNAPDGNYSVETRVAGTFGYLAPEYAATGRVTTKVDVYAFGVVLMEIITGRKALDETMPDEDERTDLVTWFRGVVINKDNFQQALDQTLEPDKETYDSIWRMAELAVHCTSRGPLQRPDMGNAVNVLGPLVEQWIPSRPEEEDSHGIDIHMRHSQALQSWQSDEGTSTTDDISGYSYSSIPSNN